MRLTRRDALAAVGVTAGVSAAAVGADRATDGTLREAVFGESEQEGLPEETRETLRATAAVVYPSEATGIEEFVAGYTAGRLASDPDRRPGLIDAARELFEAGETFHGEPFPALGTDRRDETLRSLGVDTAEPAAEGTIPERIRYYVVNDLLYAFYASPTGGELVGTPNPIGYPGGYRTALSGEHRRAEPADTRDPTGGADG